MNKIIKMLNDAWLKAHAKLTQPGYWLEMLSVSLLVLAYASEGEAAGPLTARLSFTLLWAGLILGLVFSTIGAASFAISGKSASETKPNTTFDWCLDFTCWALIVVLGWTVTAVVFLIACVWRHLVALGLSQARARAQAQPDINPSSGVDTFLAELSDLQIELHADGLLVPTSDYLLCDAGLALRDQSLVRADLRLLFHRRMHQPDGGRGPQQLLFCVPVLGSYWPGVFVNPSVIVSPDVDADITWPEELGQEGETK